MKNRSGPLSFVVSLVVSLTLACSSHKSPVSQTSDRAPKGDVPNVAAAPQAAGKVDAEFVREAAAQAAKAETSSPQSGPIAFYAVAMAETAPLSDIAAAKGSRAEADPTVSQPGQEINELNSEELRSFPERLELDHAVARRDGAIAAVPQGTPGLPAPSLTFDGNSSANNTAVFGSTVAPPDTNGAVGPNHYVQMVNNLTGIYDKTGALLVPRFPPSAVFGALGPGNLCANINDGDPVVLYDKLSGRWVLSQFGFASSTAPPYHECIAVSKTADPTGQYYAYDFVLPGNQFPDYPKLGTWPDAYYMTTNQFFLGGGGDGAGAFAFDRAKMLVGDPTAGAIYFNLCATSGHCSPFYPEFFRGMLPSDFDGFTPPPAGAKNIFSYPMSVTFGDPTDGARLFEFTPNFATPASSTFVERADSPAPLTAYDGRNPSGRGDVREPAPGENLESLATRFMHRLQYMNRGGIETWTSNITVNVGTGTVNATNYRAAPRWFTLTRSTPAGPITTQDQSTFAPDPLTANRGRWMSSAALDASGNLALGYSRTSTTAGDFPSLFYTGRLVTDPPGTLEAEVPIFAGSGTQTGTSNRWGDYSAMQIDPVDYCTFWYTNEYYAAGNTSFNWRTRIAKFKYPSCVTPLMGTLSGTITYCQNGQPIKGAVITVSDGHGAATIANGTYSVNLAPGSYTITVADPFANCGQIGPFPVTINAGSTTTQDLCLTGSPLQNLVAENFDDSSGNNNGHINRDECFKVNTKLENDGCLADNGISATLSTSTPGVVIDQNFSTYPNLDINASAFNTTPYRVHTTPAFVCGTPIDFTLSETSSLGAPRTFNFSFPTCGGGAAVPFSGTLVNTDNTAVSRLGRNGIVSACGSPKGCPGAFDANARFYDSYTFQNTSAVTECLTINLDASSCNTALLAAAYLDTFNPANLCQNYLGDAGGSGNNTSLAVNIPAGHSLVVAIQQTTVGVFCPTPGYTGTVTGFIDDTDAGASKLNSLSPAHEWIGLKNSDDVGTNFDLKAEVFRNGTLVGSGELDNQPGGSSGFNNAKDRVITLALSNPGVDTICSGESLSIKLSARVTTTGGHNTGTLRLWYNDAQANTRFDANIGGTDMNLYLLNGFVLGTSPGAGPKMTIDVLLGRTTWKTIGTWNKNF